LSATSFFLEAFHAPKDGIGVDLALVTRPAPGASPPRFAPPDNFASGLIDELDSRSAAHDLADHEGALAAATKKR